MLVVGCIYAVLTVAIVLRVIVSYWHTWEAHERIALPIGVAVTWPVLLAVEFLQWRRDVLNERIEEAHRAEADQCLAVEARDVRAEIARLETALRDPNLGYVERDDTEDALETCRRRLRELES